MGKGWEEIENTGQDSRSHGFVGGMTGAWLSFTWKRCWEVLFGGCCFLGGVVWEVVCSDFPQCCLGGVVGRCSPKGRCDPPSPASAGCCKSLAAASSPVCQPLTSAKLFLGNRWTDWLQPFSFPSPDAGQGLEYPCRDPGVAGAGAGGTSRCLLRRMDALSPALQPHKLLS